MDQSPIVLDIRVARRTEFCMFTVTTESISEIRPLLSPLSSRLDELLAGISSYGAPETKGPRPFVQLSAFEISEEDQDEAFDYAEMTMASVPIGLPLEIEPVSFGEDPRQRITVFPVEGFYSYLVTVAPDIIAAYEKAGSLQAYLDVRGDEITAREYLYAGLANCIDYGKREGQALTIEW
jgi:hypothetical protein